MHLVPDMLTEVAGRAHLTEQSRTEIDYKKVSDIPRRNSNTSVSKRECKIKINLKWEQYIEVIPPLTEGVQLYKNYNDISAFQQKVRISERLMYEP
jgi:hypothetical protein